jgi:hypothetical protein
MFGLKTICHRRRPAPLLLKVRNPQHPLVMLPQRLRQQLRLLQRLLLLWLPRKLPQLLLRQPHQQ